VKAKVYMIRLLVLILSLVATRTAMADERGAAMANSVANEMIPDSASKYEDSHPEESEKQGGPWDLRNFGITTSYDRDVKASENRESRKCSGGKIEKLC
jgi:hypothetical protein